MLGSSSSSPPRGAEVSSSRRPQATGHDKIEGLRSRQGAPPARVDQRPVRSRAVPSGTGAFEPQKPVPRQADPPRRSEEHPASACQLYNSSDCPDSDSLKRHRSQGRSSDSAPTPSASSVAEPSAESLLIRGGGALNVHVYILTGRGDGPAPVAAEAGGTAPKRTRESVAAVEAAGRSGATPETAGPRRVVPEQGLKRTAPSTRRTTR
jgi:hypothetical protein